MPSGNKGITISSINCHGELDNGLSLFLAYSIKNKE